MTGLSFGLLGPIRVWSGGDEVEVRSPQQQAVLALLLLSEGRQVSLDDVVGALWGPAAPRTAAGTARTYISRLRRMLTQAAEAGLGTEAEIRSAGRGYQLVVHRGGVDIKAFRQATATAREARERGDIAEASRSLRGGLALWRGRALDGLSGAYFDGRRAWLEQLRATAAEELWALDIELGSHSEVITDLQVAATEQPYRERLWELLMWALYRDGRQAEALSAYDHIGRLLDQDLGLEPGPGLRKMHARISAADRHLV